MSRTSSPPHSSEAYSRSLSPPPYRPRSQSMKPESRRHRRSPSPSQGDKTNTALKTSLVFLGVVGAATLVANKFWPRGILYGEKEEYDDKKRRRDDNQGRMWSDVSRKDRGDQRRAPWHGNSEDIQSRPSRHRHEEVRYRRELVYEPKYIVQRSRSAGQRRAVEAEKDWRMEDDRRHIRPGYARDGMMPNDASGRYETTGMQNTERSAPRPRIYVDDDPPHPSRSTRRHRTVGCG